MLFPQVFRSTFPPLPKVMPLNDSGPFFDKSLTSIQRFVRRNTVLFQESNDNVDPSFWLLALGFLGILRARPRKQL